MSRPVQFAGKTRTASSVSAVSFLRTGWLAGVGGGLAAARVVVLLQNENSRFWQKKCLS